MRNTTIALLAPEALTATKTGTAVDLVPFHGLADFIVTASATGGEGQTAVVTIEHSDESDTGFAEVAEFAPVDDTGGSVEVITLNVDQLKQYVRAVVTLDGDTPTVTCGVLVSGKRNYG